MTTTVYVARRIITMNPGQPTATHVAVRDGRILAVGDLADMQAWGPHTLDTRFAQHVLLPGFVEGHSHLKEGGMWQWPYLGWFERMDPAGRRWPGVRTLPEVVARLGALEAALAATQPAALPLREGGEVPAPLVVWGFDPIYFTGTGTVDAALLDQVGDGCRPIVIAHANGHLMTVNSAMLRAAGIDADTDVEGVVKHEAGPRQGQPTGELQEPAAMHLVLRCIGNAGLSAPMDDAGLQGFAAIARRQGVTTATDLVNRLGEKDLAVLRRATEADDFSVRLLPAFQGFHGTHAAAAGAEHVLGLMAGNTDRLRFGLVKMMLDGSIQGFSARLRWPGYFKHPLGAPTQPGEPYRNGIWVIAPQQFETDFEVYHRAGLTVHTHTNGDEASQAAIEAVERVLARAPRAGHRHTLQHGQMIDRAQFRRMAAVGLCANLFANHVWFWG